MKLSLGPVQFYWSAGSLHQFYDEMAKLPLDVIYLGETVCSKRRAFSLSDWLALARKLKTVSHAEIVLSGLTLIEATSELSSLKRLCRNGEFLVEANDMGAVQFLIEQNLPFVAGPALNVYSGHALAELRQHGMCRWVPPVEASCTIIGSALQQLDELGISRPEVEIFAYGHLPLAYSARCFTSRAENRPKDDCQLCCMKYPEGIAVNSQEGEIIFTLNGIQTMSGKVCHLLPHYEELQALGANLLRLSPRIENMGTVIGAYDDVRQGRSTSFTEIEACDGFWHGKAGMTQLRRETEVC